jgi:hypothetical protein
MGLNMWVIWLTRTLGAHRNGDHLPEMPYGGADAALTEDQLRIGRTWERSHGGRASLLRAPRTRAYGAPMEYHEALWSAVAAL